MTDKEILECALAAYEKAAVEGWDLERLRKENVHMGICFFLMQELKIPYEETARILRLRDLDNFFPYDYPRNLAIPLRGIIYRRDYLRKLLNE